MLLEDVGEGMIGESAPTPQSGQYAADVRKEDDEDSHKHGQHDDEFKSHLRFL